MVSPQVAVTAAHCIFDGMDGLNPTYNGNPIYVDLTNKVPGGARFRTRIKEIR